MRTSVQTRLVVALALPFGALGLFWLGCATTSCEETLDCAKVGVGPEGASPDVADGGAPDGPPAVLDGCVTASAPKDDACVLQDPVGVFVSPGGDDAAEGTAAKPVLTVGRAVAIARLAGKTAIFVCGGTYTSAVEVTPGPGVAIYGGLACPGPKPADAGAQPPPSDRWKYDGTLARFAPSAMPPAGAVLLVDQLASTTIFADLAIVAPPATAPGASSVAAFVRNCPAVKLARVELTAGAGAPGADGQDGAFTDTSRTQGSNNAGGSVTCQCTTGGATTGAGGGAGGAGATGGGSGAPALGGSPPKNGAGGAAGCSGGAEGADGAPGASGAPAAQTTLGTLTAMGWQSAAAVRAGNGGTAQGGGGGGGSLLGGGGGGGGCGGCGGQGATSGGQGGSSIGLLVFQSNVATDGCTITTGAGGQGGAGGEGQAGQAGGGAGSGACGGGKGGTGGAGGGGGGGLGGNAFGVAFKGQAPTGQPKVTVGAFGAAGAGGTSVVPASAGQAGKPGVAAAVQLLP